MSQKFLDLAGLTAYDRMLKEWFKAGVVDITDEAIKSLFVTIAEGPADNEIWYTSSDGNVVKPSGYCGASIVSNEYNDGKGVITFDGPITQIGLDTFRMHTSLTSIMIPNSVTSIKGAAFSDCSSLATVTIGNSVTSIGDYAFQVCSSLTSITIPNSVTSIGGGAFQSSSKLTSITFEGTMEKWNGIEKGSNWNKNIPATHVQCSDGQVAL